MKIAVVTMVFNEREFLPIWLRHYGPQVGYENLFVIDDGSTDGSTNNECIINLIKKPHGVFDEEDRGWRRAPSCGIDFPLASCQRRE